MDFHKLMREERRRLLAEKQAQATPQPSIESVENKAHASTTQPSSNAPVLLHQTLRTWTQRSAALDLTKYRVDGISTVYYVPNWLSEDEENSILDCVYALPDHEWVKLKHRRLQMWGGEVKPPFTPQKLPKWLLQIIESLVESQVFSKEMAPNHALINEYGVGEGIMPHEDGPSYFPLVAIISTGAEARVTFAPHRKLTALAPDLSGTETVVDLCQQNQLNFQLQRRSLLIFTDEAYKKYLHSIDNVEDGTRISLTIRHVYLPKESTHINTIDTTASA